MQRAGGVQGIPREAESIANHDTQTQSDNGQASIGPRLHLARAQICEVLTLLWCVRPASSPVGTGRSSAASKGGASYRTHTPPDLRPHERQSQGSARGRTDKQTKEI